MTILRRLREIVGWTQEDVAEQVGCCARYIGHLECRTYPVCGAMATRLAALYVTAPAELVDEDRFAKLL